MYKETNKIVRNAITIILTLMVVGIIIRSNNDETISCGCIYDKKIAYVNSSIFHEANTEYRLYVKGNDVVPFLQKVIIKRYFTVSEEIYNLYSIGDYFDSQNPKALSLSEQNVRNE